MLRLITGLILLAAGVLTAAGAPDDKPKAHFAWGVEAGGSIDMTSNDMSTLNLDIIAGYRNSWIDVVGIGTGIHVMVNNNCRAFPIYGVMRTGFRSKPSLCFLDLRAGIVHDNTNQESSSNRLYLAPGVGFNLARSKRFASYVLLAYEYNGMRSYDKAGYTFDIDGLSMATVKIGITF